MGQEIKTAIFNKNDFACFYKKLAEETRYLQDLILQKQFSTDAFNIGIEIEAWLVDDAMQVSANNVDFLKNLNDPLAFPELAKFNVELNSIPQKLSANTLSVLHQNLIKTWETYHLNARALNNHIVMIGTLPTLKLSDMTLANISRMKRYKALNEQIIKARGKPIDLDIIGIEHLKIQHHNVMLESASTSLQLHTQVPLAQAHHFYNASIMASAAMVAVCANAPYLLGHNIWHESRIPLFEQSIESGGYGGTIHGPIKRVSFGSDYARGSIMECFQENLEHFPVLLPTLVEADMTQLEHLRMHNGTVWRWNRPIIGFDSDNKTPHIRVEHRSPSAGTSLIDTIANAAFYYGLSKNLCDAIEGKELSLEFHHAKDNFYQAARFGLDSTVIGFDGNKHKLQKLIQSDLLIRAKQGLQTLNISANDITAYLGIIEQRVANKQTGSQWQRQFMQQEKVTLSDMTKAYLAQQSLDKPVSQWEIK